MLTLIELYASTAYVRNDWMRNSTQAICRTVMHNQSNVFYIGSALTLVAESMIELRL